MADTTTPVAPTPIRNRMKCAICAARRASAEGTTVCKTCHECLKDDVVIAQDGVARAQERVKAAKAALKQHTKG